ncbi:MAG TPA: hypothetical protein VKY89_18950 [Thermoanaerobaculia bacterium]|nr:hypothetical protein [Thermoanaerobaculia bacterium]
MTSREKRFLTIGVLAVVVTALAGATMAMPALAVQPASGNSGTADGLAALSFLVGEWEGVGGGGPGQGTGTFSFQRDLQQRVLVRHNHSEYPAAAGRPAAVHDDLMVVYSQGEPPSLRAIYFDSEGHVIQYAVQLAGSAAPAETRSVTFTSDAAPTSPRYRLTYRMTGADTVEIRFEIAPPGKPDGFVPYIAAGARRKPTR